MTDDDASSGGSLVFGPRRFTVWCGSVSFCLSLGSGALVGPSCSAGMPCSEGYKRQDPESKAPSSWQLLLSAKKIQRMDGVGGSDPTESC